MNTKATDNERVDPMLSPPHLSELIRESMEEVGWNFTETAARLGCDRGDPIAFAERQGGGVSQHGVGTGGCCLGYRRSLDANGGELRARPSAKGTRQRSGWRIGESVGVIDQAR